MNPYTVLRYSAFTTTSDGGNPAGVVLDAGSLSDTEMQEIAANVGYSETAFVTSMEKERLRVRFFAPEGEVDFCGHATIALGSALAQLNGSGRYTFVTNVGDVEVRGDSDTTPATSSFLISEIGSRALSEDELDSILDLFGWSPADLHPDLPPAVGDSGNLHPVLVAADPSRLADLDFDFSAAQKLSREKNWITFQLIAPIGPGRWRARDPFPWGGVIEDAATGSAAAAFLGYLRAQGRVADGESLTIDQGVEMGRPSTLTAVSNGNGARVQGAAVQIESEQ